MSSFAQILEPIASWGVDDVCSWLNGIELGRFERHFRCHDITGQVLFDLDHEHLKEMQIVSVGDRSKILCHIKKLYRDSQETQATFDRQQTDSISSNASTTTVGSSILRFPNLSFSVNPLVERSKLMRVNPGSIITSFGMRSSNDTEPNSPGSADGTLIYSGSGQFFTPFCPPPVSAPEDYVDREEKPYVDIMTFESVRRTCIRVSNDDGQSSFVINIRDLKSSLQVLERIYQKFGLSNDCGEHNYNLVAIEHSGAIQCLTRQRLWAICTDPSLQHLRDRLFLTKRERDRESIHSRKSVIINERPTSDVVSLNLDVFFPAYSQADGTTSVDAIVHKFQRPPRSPLRICTDSVFSAHNRFTMSSRSENVETDTDTLTAHADESENIYYTLASFLPGGDEDHVGLREWIKGDLIGQGSFAKVYYGINPATGEIMAVKQVDIPSSMNMGGQRTKFIQSLAHEINLLKMFNHENIVKYYGSMCDGNNLNVFLEYIDGGCLASLLRKLQFCSVPDTVHYLKQILSGISYLHMKNIVHRDIKSANILITSSGKVKIGDFGVSKLLDGVAKRFSVQGSVFWMAPELVRSQECSTKSDIWSVGCLVLEMLTGEHPWFGLDQIQAFYRIGMLTSNPLDHFFSAVRSRASSSVSSLKSCYSSLLQNRDQVLTGCNESIRSTEHLLVKTPVLNEKAIDFIKECLRPEPENRPSACQLLNHGFVRDDPGL